jgi:hypothetical protein
LVHPQSGKKTKDLLWELAGDPEPTGELPKGIALWKPGPTFPKY